MRYRPTKLKAEVFSKSLCPTQVAMGLAAQYVPPKAWFHVFLLKPNCHLPIVLLLSPSVKARGKDPRRPSFFVCNVGAALEFAKYDHLDRWFLLSWVHHTRSSQWPLSAVFVKKRRHS